MQRLALIVHGADFPKEINITRESAGLWAISQGFGDEVASDDAEIVERASFIDDAFLVSLRRTNEPPCSRFATAGLPNGGGRVHAGVSAGASR